MQVSHRISLLFFSVWFSFFQNEVTAQSQDNPTSATTTLDTLPKTDCEERDVGDIVKSIFGKNKIKPIKPVKTGSLLLLPAFSVNPTNGLLFGISGNGTKYFGPKENTSISLINFNVAYTTKKQVVTFLKSGIYTKEDKLFLQGDIRYYKYSLPTFGLGTNSPDTIAVEDHFAWLGADLGATGGSFPMVYDYIIFNETVNRQIVDNFYLGIGYELNAYWNIKDNALNLDSMPMQVTPHWGYSKLNGFDTSKYVVSGLSLNLMYDTRDNQVNPYKGYYININYRYNPTFLGSAQNSSELWLEFRTYVGLSKKTPRHLIAFWVFGNFQTSGKMPYYTLMSLGDDQKARSGRGYIAGRYRGENLMYTEIEYRFPISKCKGTFGGVLFVNATTSSNKATNTKLFDYVQPSAGVGLRILFNKRSRLNMGIDYARGYKSQGFYFAGAEVF